MRLVGIMALALVLPVVASAVPLELRHSGRLLDSGGLPINGSCALDVGLFASQSGGAALWNDSISTTCDDGYFAVTLGEGTPLDAALFDGSELWLQLAVNGGAALPQRQSVVSVPYAVRAGNLAPGSVIDASEIRVDGQVVIDSSGSLSQPVDWDDLTNKPSVIGELSCAVDQVALFDGGSWVCAAYDHDAADIVTGTLDFLRLPVGDLAGTVAEGNHTHDGADITSGTVGFAYLPVGDIAGTVAEGVHTHDAGDIVGGTLDFTVLPVGDVAGTVAEGNHTHDGADITSGTVGFAYLPVGNQAGEVAEGDHTHQPFTAAGTAVAQDGFIEVVHGLGTELISATGWYDDGTGWASAETSLRNVCSVDPFQTLTDMVVSSDTTLDTSQPYYVSSLTVSSGVTVDFTGGQPFRVYSDGPVDIQGTLDARGLAGVDITTGNRYDFKPGGAGGPGGFDGGDGTDRDSGPGNGDGTAGLGAGGGGFSVYGGCSNGGGGGGGGHAATGIGGTGGQSCGQPVGAGGSSYSSVDTGSLIGGSGGGGGAYGTAANSTGGSGGGGGGVVHIQAPSIDVSGSVLVDGGRGGNIGNSLDGGGGGGGSGGSVWFEAGTTDVSGIVSAVGGAGGTVTAQGGPGGAGSDGRVRFDAGGVTGTSNPAFTGNGVAWSPPCTVIADASFELVQVDDNTVRLYNRGSTAVDLRLVVARP